MEYGTQRGPGGTVRRSSRETETKEAFKTTEFWVFVVILIGLFIAGLVADSGDDSVDGFGAERVWLYAVILSVGYMVSRGIAKSGSRTPSADSNTEGGIADRVKAAAQVLREGDSSTEHAQPTQQTQQVQPEDQRHY